MGQREDLVKDAIIDRVRRGVCHYEDRNPLRVWFELQNLLGNLRIAKQQDADDLIMSYRCIGGPKDGERLALPRGRYEFHVARLRELRPMAAASFADSLLDFETLTYTLRTNQRTGEQAFVFQGHEAWL